ncbi:hypothetical protein Agabi119p4_1063 [Agaricus bisporus var. burnettii]|uniref:AB hydrolase-1 domain-containing protein n=1 Tax=Agaricus bisporus var. burnettii TaxID=192524 RepID=A0A8H7KLC8_AGABI|nr:hypothetical protein Agabi119p4_1063 [Agaricus bisporus var. burnettii]
MALQVDPFIFDCPSRRSSPWPSLKMTANRYRINEKSPPKDGLTLMFFHCIGSHKEVWEPVISHILQSQSDSRSLSQYKVREAWAFDWPTHGEAAVINRPLLQERTDCVSVYDWVPGIVSFVRSEHVHGHRLVLCGHSAGASTAAHTAAEFYPDLSSIGITSLILVEPMLVTREVFNSQFEDRMDQMEFAISSTSAKRDHWESRSDALQYFQKRFPWSMWDRKSLMLYVKHGLYQLENGTVTLKCDKKREAESFPDVDPSFEGILRVGELCHNLPVHAIWGTRNDLVPDFIKESLNDTSQGRRMASVTKVEDCGHMARNTLVFTQRYR